MKTNTNWKREIPPIFNEVREKIENIEDYHIKNILRIAYFQFGLEGFIRVHMLELD